MWQAGRKSIGGAKKFPSIQIKMCNVAEPKDHLTLFEWATANFPHLNILVNNAGIQRQIDFTKGNVDLMAGEDEILINFSAPVQLSALFIPHLMKQKQAAIMNISSGLGFVPLTIVPVYCATKAAIHSLIQLVAEASITKNKCQSF